MATTMANRVTITIRPSIGATGSAQPSRAVRAPARCSAIPDSGTAGSAEVDALVSRRTALLSAAVLPVALNIVAPVEALPAWADSEDGEGGLPKIGKTAPDFALPTQLGSGEWRLSDNRGKYVVLYFYPKDFTGGCTIEANRFQRDIDEFKARNAAVVGVSVDDVGEHKKFCDSLKLTFPLLADTKAVVSDLYGSLDNFGPLGKFSARQTYLIDPEGVLVERWLNVNPSRHSQEVLATLDKLKA